MSIESVLFMIFVFAVLAGGFAYMIFVSSKDE